MEHKGNESDDLLPRVENDALDSLGSNEQHLFAGMVRSLRRDPRNNPRHSQTFAYTFEGTDEPTSPVPPGWLMFGTIGLGIACCFMLVVNLINAMLNHNGYANVDPDMIVLAVIAAAATVLVCCFRVITQMTMPAYTRRWLLLFNAGWAVLALEFLFLSNW